MLTGWVRKIDRSVRQFGGELPVDAFLPELTSGHLQAGTRLGQAEPGTPAPPDEPSRAVPTPAARTRPARDAESTQPQSREALQKEIQEFMNRDPSGSADDEDDFSEFLSNSIDPNIDD